MEKKHSHYYDPAPRAEHDRAIIHGQFEDRRFSFVTDSGVFSKRQIDPGTTLLLQSVLKEIKDTSLRVLDLGTGAGVMAIVLARLRPSLTVTGSDINSRAVTLAKENAKQIGVPNVRFIEADGVPGDTVFDLVICNPPIRAGKDTVYRLFREVRDQHAAEGVFYIVIRVKQGASSAKKELSSLFDRVETVARAKGYHVIKARGKREYGDDKDA
ncbi:MAG: methyltransferase [Clostridiales bacterium]|jgi:16S rRNA (guanine1207-N2)-methyltransferase|nr:methyltransferase [Clostridiales bacterium]MDD2572605.1 methyltransferase [Eubacteriales bacterium]MDY0119523.1 methyltransferase [Clostridia bacterium]NLG29693.1 class I SAM-dependent methyltransferase [Clostridiaceae bacterium]MCK9349706.1 methyltransferase [Clostridiales bacterium]